MEPYLGSIMLVSFDFNPPGWHACDGSMLSTDTYSDLFSLVGTRYGGDGRTNFGLPNLPSPDGGNSRYLIALRGMYPSRG